MKFVRLIAIVLGATACIPGGAAGSPAGSPARSVDLPSPVPCNGCWVPAVQTEWQWQLNGTVDQSVDVAMYDIDGFDNGAQVVQQLHDAGRAVVCYIDAGTWENWRPDAARFPRRVKGNRNGWPGERWLDIRKLGVLEPIMSDRIGMCAQKGFDGIEFDNVDGYANRTGFPLTAADQLRYNTWLANAAHTAGLSVALKNDTGQVTALLPYFDYALVEQCFQYHECDAYTPFVSSGRAVFEVEYKLDTSQFCDKANTLDFNAMKKKLALGAWRVPCR